MLAMPDPATAFIDPFCAVPTLSLTCTIAETGTKELYTRDPRGIAQRANDTSSAPAWPIPPIWAGGRVLHLRQRAVRQQDQCTFYSVDSEEAVGTRVRTKCPTPVTRFAIRKGISPSPPPTRSRTFGPRCAW